MKPTVSLRLSLLLALAACFAVVSALQLAARYFIELPQLRAVEYVNDVRAVARVKRSLALEMSRKEDLATDNGQWRDSYDFMQLDQESSEFADFVTREYGYKETIHVVPRVNGHVFYRPDGQIFFESNFDLATGTTDAALGLPLDRFLPGVREGYGAVDSGFVDSPLGPVLFAITGVTDDDATLPPNGYLLVWRKVDDLFVDELIGPTGVELEYLPAESAHPLVKAIREQPQGVLPRGDSNHIAWLIEDVEGRALAVVSQETPPRAFYDGLFSTASVVGLSSSVLMLIVLALFVSRRVISPIVELSAFAEVVAKSDDFSQRLHTEREDEIGTVARRFDQLLDKAEEQEALLRSENADLEAQAEHDPLTGIQNRRAFDRALNRDWSLAMRNHRPLTCIMIDVDFFKRYNDHYGHQAGDTALQAVAASLQDCLKRATDCISRYGGEEFIVLLVDTENAHGLKIAERMVKSIETLAIPHEHSDCAKTLTVSAGVATITPLRGLVADTLMKLADQALYQAKKNGRNRVANSRVALRQVGTV